MFKMTFLGRLHFVIQKPSEMIKEELQKLKTLFRAPWPLMQNIINNEHGGRRFMDVGTHNKVCLSHLTVKTS